jgi:hypothetical protein
MNGAWASRGGGLGDCCGVKNSDHLGRHRAGDCSAGDGADQHELAHPFRLGDGQFLGDHAAQAGTGHAGPLDASVVQDG